MKTHLSLFSGIGGLDLAAEWAGFTTVGQCEWADYPTKVLEKHWPDVPRWRDIHDLSAVDFERRTGRKTVDVISGGFPCQPHSVAGKRKASSDERDLWPEMRRVIGEIRPEWVVGENVRGLLSSEDGWFFRGILRDFADLGYSVGWCLTSAAAVGANHLRERVAIIARNANGKHDSSKQTVCGGEASVSKRICADVPNAEGIHVQGQHYGQREAQPWGGSWWSVEPDVGRVANGVPDRVDKLKCLGNAVVPQQFYPIFQAIADIIDADTAERMNQ